MPQSKYLIIITSRFLDSAASQLRYSRYALVPPQWLHNQKRRSK